MKLCCSHCGESLFDFGRARPVASLQLRCGRCGRLTRWYPPLEGPLKNQTLTRAIVRPAEMKRAA